MSNTNLGYFPATEPDGHLPPPSLSFNSLSNSSAVPLSDISKQNPDANAEAAKTEEYASVTSDQTDHADPNVPSASITNGRTDSLDQTTDRTYTPSIPEVVDPDTQTSSENDRILKPSKIPVLKSKHAEGSSSASNSDISIKCTSPVAVHEEYDAGKASNMYSIIPTSPITGKKYRSPLSAQRMKPFDRSRKMTNGDVSSNNTCDNANSVVSNVSHADAIAPVMRNIDDELSDTPPVAAVAKSETNSGRNTPNFVINSKPSGDASNNVEIKEQTISVSNAETLSSEKKPRFKWMFGPHKNANVV